MTAKRTTTMRAAVLCSSILYITVLGCQREPKSPQDLERTALVAQKCPEIDPGSELIDAKNARVFVEVVALSGPPPPSPIGNWLDEHAVTVRSSSNLVAFPNVPTSMPWGQCVDAVCRDTQRTLTVTAQLPQRGTDPIELAVRIEEAALNEGAAAKVLLDTTLQAPSQEPVVLPTGTLLSSGTVVVTSYLLRQIDDLHRLLECKVRQGDREKQL